MDFIAKNILDSAMTYAEYRALISTLLAEGKTSRPDPHPELLEYTQLNEQRMNRIDKKFRLDDAAAEQLKTIQTPIFCLVISEGWCGDAAQIVPTLQHLALENPQITLRFILRDEHLDLMDAFLTDGGRSIPKVIFVEPDSGRVLGHWGPRPAEAHRQMLDFKAQMLAETDKIARAAVYETAKTAIHTWYAHDRTVSTQREFLAAILAAK